MQQIETRVMSRSFIAALNRAARASVLAARARARERAAQAREHERRQRLNEKIAKQDYLDGRISEAEEANAHLNEVVNGLKNILRDGLEQNPLDASRGNAGYRSCCGRGVRSTSGVDGRLARNIRIAARSNEQH
ncbi:MAG TPA: hypothetical protein VEI03_01125, partial [Stellaceae bacterium]|nr:hypothetical protein [Stellaceae bacterium]